MAIRFRFTLFITFLVLLGSIQVAGAYADQPAIYFKGPTGEVREGSRFEVEILVDSDQPLNAFSLEINFDDQMVGEPIFNNAGSIVDVWQDQPRVFEGGRVVFKGGSLKPFSGKGGLLYKISFLAKETGEAEFLLARNSFVYLANGKGTEVSPKLGGLALVVKPGTEGGGEVYAYQDDMAPPVIEFAAIEADPINTEQKLVSFVVKDDVSGTKEVMVRSLRWLWWEAWERALNPTAFPKGVWAIQLEAIDNNGNIGRQTVFDWFAFFKYFLPTFVLVFAVVGVVVNKFLKRKRYN